MDIQQDSSKTGVLPSTTSRTLSSSSSAFLSASQSPFFSPQSPKLYTSEQLGFNDLVPSDGFLLNNNSNNHRFVSENLVRRLKSISSTHIPTTSSCISNLEDPETLCDIPVYAPASRSNCSDGSSSCSQITSRGHLGRKESRKKNFASHLSSSVEQSSTAFSSYNRSKAYDVYLGYRGRKSSLLRFVYWLQAELERYGLSCFAADQSECKNSRSHDAVKKVMRDSTFGVVILTKRSFANPYTIEELQTFLGKKNLVPIYFDFGVNDCLARDIIEQKGELWERHGGELWMLYDGSEKEWKYTLNGLIRMDDWRLEAHNGNWRDCILNTIILLATRLGRRNTVEKVTRWKERVEKEEFPFPRNDDFVGRRKELSELELILFGNVSGDSEKEYIELKTKRKQKSFLTPCNENFLAARETMKNRQSEGSSRGKNPVVWKESEKDIKLRMENTDEKRQPGRMRSRKYRRTKSTKILYGKGIACVTGDPGIGKTELALEYAYRFSQRYKMVVWIGGEARYIRQNYLNLRPLLELDVSTDNSFDKGRVKSFEKQEKEAISKVKKELTRGIPFLVIIDNLEDEKDWWDRRNIMDLLPLFGGETHFIITTRLPQVMDLESMKLSFLSGVEAISLMKGSLNSYPATEIDSLRAIEERLGRLPLGLGIVGAVLSELPISPSRLLDTVSRTPLRVLTWNDRDINLRQNTFLMQLLEVCFSMFDHADCPRSLATRMVQVSSWFAPYAIPLPLLALAANKIPNRHPHASFWKKCLPTLSFGCGNSNIKRSEAEAYSMLVRFGVARKSSKPECIHFHDVIKLYARKRGTTKVAQSVVHAVSLRGSLTHHPEHLWAACFLLFGLGSDPVVVEPKPSELIPIVKHVVLPLAIHTFITFSRCNVTLKLLLLCTESLEVAAESLLSQPEKCLNRSICCRKPVESNANTALWQELALLRATVLETRAKLLIRGGKYDLGDDLIRKAIFIRTSIHGEHHPDTISTKETLSKLVRLRSNTQTT